VCATKESANSSWRYAITIAAFQNAGSKPNKTEAIKFMKVIYAKWMVKRIEQPKLRTFALNFK